MGPVVLGLLPPSHCGQSGQHRFQLRAEKATLWQAQWVTMGPVLAQSVTAMLSSLG